MSSLRRNNNDLEIKDMSCESKVLKIKSGDNLINVYDEDTIKKLINNKFNKQYTLLLKALDEFENNDQDDDGTGDVLYREFDNLLDEIMYKYKDYLSEKEIIMYGKKLINLRTRLLMILENKAIRSR